VGRDENGHAFLARKVYEQLPELIARDRINSGRWLVEQQRFRLVNDGDGK